MAGKQVKTFNCPACGGVVSLLAAGHSVTAICTHCSTLIDTANENYRIILKNRQSVRETDIPMGAKGVLGGIKWEAIGYVEKKDISGEYFWEEYLLFNPYYGFRFLVQGDDHWSLARIIKRDVPVTLFDNTIIFDGQQFDVFYRSTATVDYVKGEFYWRIRKGDQDKYADYIAPPRMLSMEMNQQEITLSMSEYLLPEEIEQAFGVSLPPRRGIAPNQPPPFSGVRHKIWAVAVCTLLVAFVVHLGSSGRQEVVNTTIFHVMPDNSSKSFSTGVFFLPKRTNVEVHGSATPLQNNWVDLDLTLVNDTSNNAYEASQSLEYYYGQEGGEYWSEGNAERETYFESVEPGNYRLVVEPAPGQLGPDGMNVMLAVTRNVRAWSNFWAAVLLIFAFPVYTSLYRRYFEYKRWENSDYAPNSKGTDSDD